MTLTIFNTTSQAIILYLFACVHVPNSPTPLADSLLQTDDTLPFRTTLLGEYALLLAKPPFGLGLGREHVRRIAQMSMEARFSK